MAIKNTITGALLANTLKKTYNKQSFFLTISSEDSTGCPSRVYVRRIDIYIFECWCYLSIFKYFPVACHSSQANYLLTLELDH